MEDTNSSIYALKTSAGQERNVARLLARKARTIDGIGISSILVPESLKGYILVESSTKIDLRNPDLKVQHLRGVVEGKGGITFEEAKETAVDQLSALYEKKYNNFKKIYPAMKNLFKEKRARFLSLQMSLCK